MFEIENKILLACARVKLREKDKSDLLSYTSRTVDWENLLFLATRHKLLPLLYKHLSSCSENIPINILAYLSSYYDTNALQNLNKVATLYQITSLFHSNGIEAVPVKGPILALQYFGDIALRTFSDLDILVGKHAFQQAASLLQNLGYTYQPKDIPANYFFKFSKIYSHGVLTNTNGNLIELHLELSGRYGAKQLDLNFLQQYISACNINGYNFLTLKSEFLLVYLALHAQRHCWQKYEYLICIAEVFNTEINIDWDEVERIADILKLKKVVHLAAYMAHSMLDASIDKKIISRITKSNIIHNFTQSHLSNWNVINESIIHQSTEGQSTFKKVYPISLHLINRWPDIFRVTIGKRLFFPNTSDWIRFPLPFSLNGLYYIYHPLYMIFNFLIRKLMRFSSKSLNNLI